MAVKRSALAIFVLLSGLLYLSRSSFFGGTQSSSAQKHKVSAITSNAQLRLDPPKWKHLRHLDIVNNAEPHGYTVVLLHSAFGGAGIAMFQIRKFWQPYLPTAKWVLPQSEFGTFRDSRATRWYNMDVVSQSNSTYGIPLLDAGSVESESAGIVENEKEMLHSAQGLNLLIEREMKLSNIKRDRIILVGLHQGGAMALLLALTAPSPFAGVAVVDGYLPLRHKIQQLTKQKLNIPLLWVQGEDAQEFTVDLVQLTLSYLADTFGWKSTHFMGVPGINEWKMNHDKSRIILEWLGNQFPLLKKGVSSPEWQKGLKEAEFFDYSLAE